MVRWPRAQERLGPGALVGGARQEGAQPGSRNQTLTRAGVAGGADGAFLAL